MLESVASPRDLKALTPDQLPALASEIRDVLIETVSRTSGHLGPNLGVVELTIALHRVFESPSDRIVFDTGHQAYVHKLLTGRYPEFGTLRQRGGLSGYPSQAESEHDIVENSHASTSLSYADGLAKAYRLRGEPRSVVAVVAVDVAANRVGTRIAPTAIAAKRTYRGTTRPRNLITRRKLLRLNRASGLNRRPVSALTPQSR